METEIEIEIERARQDLASLRERIAAGDEAAIEAAYEIRRFINYSLWRLEQAPKD